MASDEVEQFLELLRTALGERSFLRLVLGKPRAGAPFERVDTEYTQHRGTTRLTTRLQGGHRYLTKHWEEAELCTEVLRMLGTEFGAGTLEASTGGARIDFSRKRKPTLTVDRTARVSRGPTPLEKPWHTLLDPSAPYLRALGLVRADRQIAAGSGDKLRQIEKFLECFIAALAQAGLADSNEPIRILDIGSGKSYLTFAMYDVLTRQGPREVLVTGIEQRPELVTSSRLLAKEVGFDGLEFIEGKAGETGTSSTETQASTVVVALHACDTATDDAIMLALTMKAKALLVAPCCQKYFRRFLTVPADLQPIYRHPILEEHLAIDLTDGARVLYLESEGYRSKLFEFVSVEHTARNTMITAIRGGVTPQQSDDARKAILELRTRFGLPDIYLDREVRG